MYPEDLRGIVEAALAAEASEEVNRALREASSDE